MEDNINKIVDILDANLKVGEYFVFTKLKDGGYGITISEEREKQFKGASPKIRKLLDVLKEDWVEGSFFVGKADKYGK